MLAAVVMRSARGGSLTPAQSGATPEGTSSPEEVGGMTGLPTGLAWLERYLLGASENIFNLFFFTRQCKNWLLKEAGLCIKSLLFLKLNWESVNLNSVAPNFGLWQNSPQTDSKLSRIARLGFGEHHQRGNLDCGWQSPYTINLLFSSSSLHTGAPRQPNPISSHILPQIFSLLKHPSGVRASICGLADEETAD